MRAGERGYALILVLIFLAVGSASLVPTFRLAYSAFNSQRIQHDALQQQYARDAGAEWGIWQLLYGGASALMAEDGDELTFNLVLNGVETDVVLRLQAILREGEVLGAEGNKIRVTTTVVCAEDGDAVFDDDCLTLPRIAGLQAKFTVFLEQVSPDTSAGLIKVIEELPTKFAMVPGSVVSADGSFPEIETTTPTDILGSEDEFWKWDFSASPIIFQPGEVKQFTFTADILADPVEGIPNSGRYCNDVWLWLEDPPIERIGKSTDVIVLPNPPDGCKGGGFLVNKHISQFVAIPGQTHVVTYIANVENLSDNQQKLFEVKDVLPAGGFIFCSPTSPPPVGFSCDPPKFKQVDEPFDPETGDFNDLTGFTDWVEPAQTYDAGTDRWTLVWIPVDEEGNPGVNVKKYGSSTDIYIVRFQVHITPTGSGTFYNEIFIDANCTVPNSLEGEGITTSDYCATYSWPTGGVVVPTYDVSSKAGVTNGQGNITVGPSPSDAVFQSWHVN